jgi:hypothetical protein
VSIVVFLPWPIGLASRASLPKVSAARHFLWWWVFGSVVLGGEYATAAAGSASGKARRKMQPMFRPLTETERNAVAALTRFLTSDERREGEPENLDVRWTERFLQARTMPEHQGALKIIGCCSGPLPFEPRESASAGNVPEERSGHHEAQQSDR